MSTEHRSDPDTGEVAVSRTNSPEQVGRNNPDAGPVEAPNFYGSGTDDLRAGSGKTDAPAPGMPSTDHPRGPASGPRDSQGGVTGSRGIPLTESRADPEAAPS